MYRVIDIVPGYACNFRCVYCYESTCDASYAVQRMSDEVIAKSVEYIRNVQASLPGATIDLNAFGGEPLLHVDILQKFISRLDLGMLIITNGSLVAAHKDWLLAFRDAHPNNKIVVSYDYALQDVNRKAGTWQLVRDAIIWLHKNGLFNGTLTVFSYGDLSRIWDVFQDMLRLRHAVPELMLSFNVDNIRAPEKYDAAAYEAGLIKIREYMDRTGNYGLVKRNQAPSGRALCESDSISCHLHSGIDVNGDLYPISNMIFSRAITKQLTYLGNVFESFDALLEHRHAFFSQLNTTLPAKCQGCTVHCRINPWKTIKTSLSEANGYLGETHCQIYTLAEKYLGGSDVQGN